MQHRAHAHIEIVKKKSYGLKRVITYSCLGRHKRKITFYAKPIPPFWWEEHSRAAVPFEVSQKQLVHTWAIVLEQYLPLLLEKKSIQVLCTTHTANRIHITASSHWSTALELMNRNLWGLAVGTAAAAIPWCDYWLNEYSQAHPYLWHVLDVNSYNAEVLVLPYL